jgi:hypothetical protein
MPEGGGRLVWAVVFCFYLRIPPIFRRAKGWRRFRRGLVAPFADLRGRAVRGRTREEPGFGRRALGPGIRQTIDPMRAKKLRPLKKSPNRFRAFGQADGRQPFMPSTSRSLPLSLIPSVGPCEAGRPLSVGVSGAFRPAMGHHATVSVFCQGISEKIVGRTRYRRFRQRVGSPVGPIELGPELARARVVSNPCKCCCRFGCPAAESSGQAASVPTLAEPLAGGLSRRSMSGNPGSQDAPAQAC